MDVKVNIAISSYQDTYRKISDIKALRAATGMGLAEAKAAIEKLYDQPRVSKIIAIKMTQTQFGAFMFFYHYSGEQQNFDWFVDTVEKIEPERDAFDIR
jgi:hypothetical protein